MKILLVLFSIALCAYGKEQCEFKNLKEFASMLDERSPVLAEIEASKTSASALVEKAKQSPNPKINFQYQRGDQFGLQVNTYNLQALHTFELGDKRDKRIDESLRREELIDSQLDVSSSEFKLNAIRTYRRAQQLELQIDAVQEAILTYKNIISKLAKRRRLTPEERVSLSTLRLALGDYKGRLHDYVHEKESLSVNISYWANCKAPSFSYESRKYPKLPNYELTEDKGLAKVARKDVELARSELETQKSLGHSNLAVGPLLNYQQQGGRNFFSGGVAVSFSPQLYHSNDGGKRIAATKLRERRLAANNQIKHYRLKLQKELKVYKDSLESLLEMPTPDSMTKKHKETESLFRRGVVSIPMVIEAHRQHVEYLKSWFEIENDVLGSIKEIYVLTGNQELVEKLLQ